MVLCNAESFLVFMWLGVSLDNHWFSDILCEMSSPSCLDLLGLPAVWLLLVVVALRVCSHESASALMVSSLVCCWHIYRFT